MATFQWNLPQFNTSGVSQSEVQLSSDIMIYDDLRIWPWSWPYPPTCAAPAWAFQRTIPSPKGPETWGNTRKKGEKKEKRNIASHEELNYIKLLSLDKRIWMGPQKRTDLVRGKGFCVAALIPFIDKTSLQTLQSYIFSTECLLGCDWDPCVMQARPDFFDPCRLHVWCLYGGGMISSLSMLFQPHVSKAGNPFRERHAMARLA